MALANQVKLMKMINKQGFIFFFSLLPSAMDVDHHDADAVVSVSVNTLLRPKIDDSIEEDILIDYLRNNEHDLLIIREVIKVFINRMKLNNSQQPPPFPKPLGSKNSNSTAEYLYLREFLKEKEFIIIDSSDHISRILFSFNGFSSDQLKKENANLMGDCFSLLVGRGEVSSAVMVNFILNLTNVDPSIYGSLIGRISSRHPNASWIEKVFLCICDSDCPSVSDCENIFDSTNVSKSDICESTHCYKNNNTQKNNNHPLKRDLQSIHTNAIEVILELFIVLLSSNRIDTSINNTSLIINSFNNLDTLTTIAMNSSSPSLRIKGLKIFTTILVSNLPKKFLKNSLEKILSHFDDLLLDSSIPSRQNAKSSIKIWLENRLVPLYRGFVIEHDLSVCDGFVCPERSDIKKLLDWCFGVLSRYARPISLPPSPNALLLSLSIYSQIITSINNRFDWWKKNNCPIFIINAIRNFWINSIKEYPELPTLLSKTTLTSLHESIRNESISIIHGISPHLPIPSISLSSLTMSNSNEIDGIRKMKSFCLYDLDLKENISNNSHILTFLSLFDDDAVAVAANVLLEEDVFFIRKIIDFRLKNISKSVQEREDSDDLDLEDNNNNNNNNSGQIGDWRIVVEGLRLLRRDYKLLITALLQIRHPGAFRMIADILSTSISKSIATDTEKIEDLLHFVLGFLENSEVEITRRSAGIPMCIVAILEGLVDVKTRAEGLHIFNGLIDKIFVGLTRNPSSITHYLNILAQICSSQKLSSLSRQERCINLSLKETFLLFSSSDWNVRNSALMLFVSVLDRIFGVRHDHLQFSYRNLMDFRLLSSTFPAMISLLMIEYEKAPSFDYLTNFALYPILSILQRILFVGPGEIGNNFYCCTEDFLFSIGLCNPIKKVRRMSARILVYSMSLEGICHPSRRFSIIKRMEMELKDGKCCSPNKIDGLLFLKQLFFPSTPPPPPQVLGTSKEKVDALTCLKKRSCGGGGGGEMDNIVEVMNELWIKFSCSIDRENIFHAWKELWGRGTYDISGEYRLAFFRVGILNVKKDFDISSIIILILLGLLDDDQEVRELSALLFNGGINVGSLSTAQTIRRIFKEYSNLIKDNWELISFIPMARECDLFQPSSPKAYGGGGGGGPWREEPMNLFKDLVWLNLVPF